VGLILDLAVVALALVVIGSLALLAWTLAVSAVRATRRQRREVEAARISVGEAQARIEAGSARATASLERLAERTRPRAANGHRPSGDAPDT
jgi:hypothetical protein